MGGRKYRGVDAGPGWINRRFRDIDQQLRELRAAKGLAASTVAPGGSVFVKGLLKIVGALDLTGTLSMKSSDGLELVRMGDMQFGRGLAFTRENGVDAFVFRKSFENSEQQDWSLKDRAGNGIVEENALGTGLGKPYLEHPFQPVATAAGTSVTCGPYGWERTTSSAAWETLFAYDGKAQNRFLDFKFAALCSDADTAGQIQVVDLVTGTPLSGFLMAPWVGAIPAGTLTYAVIDPTPDMVSLPIADGVGVGGQIRVGVQVQVTVGTGSITLAIPQSIGG